jgi:hypothetical protein
MPGDGFDMCAIVGFFLTLAGAALGWNAWWHHKHRGNKPPPRG